MAIEELQGRSYERAFRLDASSADAFIEATGDDRERWRGSAPPSFAGAALFAVAPAFLYDPDVGDFSRVLIHADQTFRWRAPWELDTDYIVTGSVDRVRMRGGAAWVTFGAVVTNADDTTLESLSTFIMSAQRPDSDVDDHGEPSALQRANEFRPDSYPSDSVLPETVRSASRADVVRYAAASRDFNPLHWDHETARNAGLPGVVVHGLHSVSWMLQVAAATAPAGARAPIREAKFRFRNPLLPGQAASINGEADGFSGIVTLELSSLAGPLVTGTIEIDG